VFIEGKQGKSVVYDYTEQRLFGPAFTFVNKTTNKKENDGDSRKRNMLWDYITTSLEGGGCENLPTMCAHRGDVAWVYKEAKSWASRVSVFGMTMKIADFWQLGVDEKKGLSFHLHAVNENADEIERQARSLQLKYTIPQEVRRVHIILAAIKLCKTRELKIYID
jgi:hypothetical protein